MNRKKENGERSILFTIGAERDKTSYSLASGAFLAQSPRIGSIIGGTNCFPICG
jgi:hypothetical protein